mgnify:CR=1 FL=1
MTSKAIVQKDVLVKAVDLERLVTELLQERIRTQHNQKANHVLFGKYMENWLEIHRVKIQDTTYSGYQSIIKKYISPYFNSRGVYLDNLTPEAIQKYYLTHARSARHAVKLQSSVFETIPNFV